MEELFNKYLPILVHLFEIMGIFILTLGVFTAFYNYILKRFFKKNIDIKYEFADVMITTLDFKLAAEILKTVTIKSMDELILLASVFIIRVIMTFVLEKEMKNNPDYDYIFSICGSGQFHTEFDLWRKTA